MRSPVLQRALARKASIASLGVLHPRHFRGRSFRNSSIRVRPALPRPTNEEALGCSLRARPFVFSFVPRSKKWWGVCKEDIHPRLHRHVFVPDNSLQLSSVRVSRDASGSLPNILHIALVAFLAFFDIVRSTSVNRVRCSTNVTRCPLFVRGLDEVTFPVLHRGSRFHLGRSCVDHPLVRDLPLPPAIVARATSAAFAVRTRSEQKRMTA